MYEDDRPSIYYPDGSKTGLWLTAAPRLKTALGYQTIDHWMMSPAEQMVMIYLLENLRPPIGIEIGTECGGSLQVLAKYCEHVFSIDINPQQLAGKYNNVEYITASSKDALPALLSRLSAEGAQVGFILVDGDHSTDGVETDINNILAYQPIIPLYILMHDSFSTPCRQGLQNAKWAGCPYAHALELDLVPGIRNPGPQWHGDPMGGLAMGVLLPEKRQGQFEMVGRANLTYDTVVKQLQIT